MLTADSVKKLADQSKAPTVEEKLVELEQLILVAARKAEKQIAVPLTFFFDTEQAKSIAEHLRQKGFIIDTEKEMKIPMEKSDDIVITRDTPLITIKWA